MFISERKRVVIMMFTILFVSPITYATHGNIIEHIASAETSMQVLWDTHYATEGRDNLDGGALQTSILSIRYSRLELIIWNGWGYSSNYNELNIIPAYHFDYGDFSFYINYNRKQFTEEGLFDNEIGNGFSYAGLADNLTLDFDWYHSFDTDGTFLEFSISKLIEVSQNLELEPRIILGINNNYVPDGHDGLNHAAMQLNAVYQPVKDINLRGSLSYSQAIDRDVIRYPGDGLLQDFLWASMGVEIVF